MSVIRVLIFVLGICLLNPALAESNFAHGSYLLKPSQSQKARKIKPNNLKGTYQLKTFFDGGGTATNMLIDIKTVTSAGKTGGTFIFDLTDPDTNQVTEENKIGIYYQDRLIFSRISFDGDTLYFLLPQSRGFQGIAITTTNKACTTISSSGPVVQCTYDDTQSVAFDAEMVYI